MKNKAFKKIFIIGLTSISLNSLCYATEDIKDINGNNTNGNVTVNSGEEYGEVSGYYQYADGSTQSSDIEIIGGGNIVYVQGTANEVNGILGWSNGDNTSSVNVTVSDSTVILDGGTVKNEIISTSGYSGGNINGNFAYSSYKKATAQNGSVSIINGTVGIGKGTVYGINGSFAQSDHDSAFADNGEVTISGTSTIDFTSIPNNTYRGITGSQAITNEWNTDSKADATAKNGKITISGGTIQNNKIYIIGNLAYANGNSGGDAYADSGSVTISEDTGATNIYSSIRGSYARTTTGNATAINSTVTIKGGNLSNVIYGGYGLSNLGNNHKIEVSGNTVNISGGNVSTIIGGYGENFGTSGESITIENNKITIGGNASVTGIVAGGYFRYKNFNNDKNFKGIIKDNTITITGNANLSEADLWGLMIDNTALITEESGNNLIIDNWKGSVNSLNNFDAIEFKNITWENEGIVINVLNNDAASSLADTQIDLRGSTTLAGGTSLKKNDYMYFIKSADGSPIETSQNNILVNREENYDNIFTAGVALQGTGKVEVEEDGSVKYTITSVQNNEQTNIVPINQSLAAAFIISGNDLVVDGLNAMEQDQLFGVKTFAIVEGNDSSYDVAEDIKVNGWNGLYGIGDINELEDGNFSYAVFYENGIANYRTFNRFMNEIIRGDGRVIYNGGGLAGRYRKHNGFYAEASIRAGELRNQMKNMLRDGNGNVYGYNTEGTYYAFHLGTGKIFDIKEEQNLDVYCRYYHTYNEGDTFTVAGDRFDIDSITSDKVRIGTRYNINHTQNLNTYLGLAFEYEFNGEADVSVNDLDLPGEKLQGSSGYAEIGFVQQNDSPWSFEGRARGYVGVREGISGLLRVTYSF